MNRGLVIGLAAVAALSIYLSMQSDDDLLAPGKQGARAGKQRDAGQRDAASRDRTAGRATVTASTSASKADDKPDSKESWVSGALISGVNQWQSRLAQVEDGGQLAKLDQQAWGSMRPPPPPAPKVVYVAPPPPPPPMAPRFPHAWVGRFNDEPVAAAASGASGVVAQPVQRAILNGPETTWVVRAGDVIEGQWRVDRIQDRTMSLTYLPLKQQQTVVMR